MSRERPLLLQQRAPVVHVHVRYGSGEAIFEIENEITLRESAGLKVRELTKAQALAEEHRDFIIRRWHERHH